MLTIRAHSLEIKIDNSKEYAIYQEQYQGDWRGEPVDPDSEEAKTGKSDVYGNIFLVTETKKYIIPRVFYAHRWVSKLLDFIDSKQKDEDIFVDMDTLLEDGDGWGIFLCGQVRVERI